MNLIDCCIFTIQPHIQTIAAEIQNTHKVGGLLVVKWLVYFAEIFTSCQVFGEIYDKIRARIGDTTRCIAYGSARKCNFATLISFFALSTAIYAFTLSIYSQYFSLPLIMDWDELELATFRFGLWVVLGYSLDLWFKRKFRTKYIKSKAHPKDKLKKIEQINKIIGPSVRKIHQVGYFVVAWIGFLIVILWIENWKKHSKKKEKVNPTPNNYST